MSPEITFPDEHHWNVDRTSMIFPAVVDGKPIRCVLPFQAFMEYFPMVNGPGPSSSDVFGIDSFGSQCETPFNENKELIHRVARRFIEGGAMNDDEVIISSLHVA